MEKTETDLAGVPPSSRPQEHPEPSSIHTLPSGRASMGGVLTVGIEEEFLLLDGESGRPAASAPSVLAAADRAGVGACAEATPYQVETATPVCGTAGELLGSLSRSRAVLAAAAAGEGSRVVASGCAPLAAGVPTPLTPADRYQRMGERYGMLVDDLSVCGCHVHVGMPDRERAVLVADHLRPWLPALLALSANSAFAGGRPTGHASWRAVTWTRLPSAVPQPWFGSLAGYERASEELLISGAALDSGMLYFSVRPSERVPTVEVRIFDVAATAEEAVLYALLVRALAVVALADIDAGRAGPRFPDHTLRLALWRAAHDGLEGMSLDPGTGTLLTARGRVRQLMRRAAPGLEAGGDRATARDLLGRLFAAGSGAHRQRAAYGRRRRFDDLHDHLSRSFTGPLRPT
ncbi:carboxylate-amine ligase [Actinoalloteichus caeruleus]|uniref:carboxylate-amine ligase n=1 Tax=Actinoalloteichus cyanogriseus TaxID=2893586 RepID=UPI00068BF03C|nr:glutamate--cysteine ligase [Actinoalloteichus caeruleus]